MNYSILHNAHALARTGMKIQGNHFARIGCESKQPNLIMHARMKLSKNSDLLPSRVLVRKVGDNKPDHLPERSALCLTDPSDTEACTFTITKLTNHNGYIPHPYVSCILSSYLNRID